MLLIFLFSILTFASQEIWTHSYQEEMPVAAYFDASGFIFISKYNDSKKMAHLDKFTTNGELVETIASATGMAGPLRSYDGKIYWIVSSSVFEVTGKNMKKVFSYLEDPTDIALDSLGKVYVSFKSGEVWK